MGTRAQIRKRRYFSRKWKSNFDRCRKKNTFLREGIEGVENGERDIKKGSRHFFQERLDKYSFIELHKGQYPIEKMCKVLEVSTSGYYDWLKRAPSKHAIETKALLEDIETIYEESSQTYGSPRIQEALVKSGKKVSRARVARIMRANGIQSKIRKKYKATTDSKHEHNIAPNILDRQFKVEAPSKVWVSDITYVWTDEGWLYLTVVIDLYDRKVIGWALSLTMEARETTMAAFAMALLNRIAPKGMLFHSDRGVQYACNDFVKMLTEQGVIQSMSRKGNCWDNAVAESFFKTIKVERIYRKKYKTIQEAKLDIFSYIEAWYNTKRRHSSIGYATPLEMEQFFYKKLRA